MYITIIYQRIFTTGTSNYWTAGSSVKSISGITCRGSHRRCSVRKNVLKNFAKFAGKHLCQSLFFNKVTRLRPATLLKKGLWHRCFPMNFCKISKNNFFTEHLWTITPLDDCFPWLCLPNSNSVLVYLFSMVLFSLKREYSQVWGNIRELKAR